jgi:hypothetical protein
MRLQGEGMPLREIRAFIDEMYGKVGLSTPTPRPT